jgi:hypothetical protein
MDQMEPDMVVLSHSLEHFSDPLSIVAALGKRKKPTTLFVEVPYAFGAHAARLWHPVIYTREALLWFFQLVGVHTLSLTTHSAPHVNLADLNLVGLGTATFYETEHVEFPVADVSRRLETVLTP